MASAKVMMAEAATPATPAAESVADPAPAPVLSPAGLAAGVLAELAELALVLSSAGPGGLSGVSSGQALAVVEAVEAVKAWADAVSIDATAAMVAEFETDFVPLEPEPSHSNPPSTWECRRFLRTCRSAAAAEIQVATGLPITQCQRRVWFTACEPERVGPVREQMRLGRVTLARAMALTEATGHLDAFTASVIANRVLRPLTGPDGVPLPGVAPLSEATFRARLHRQQLIVSLSTILDLDLDLDQGVGQIPGWGCVSGQQGRALALRAGSIWKRIVTDPLTGRAIEVSAGTYKVPSGMAGQVTARDGLCRAPGCEIPAEHGDLDHTIEWEPDGAGGPTAETNLAALHRGHHNLKTAGFWDSDQSPDGTLYWTTATGRKVTTYPYGYDHPDDQPLKTSTLESRLGRRLARVLNPDIPLPGHFNIFDEIDWAQALAPATPQPRQHTWDTARANQKQLAAAATAAVASRDPGPPPF